MAKTQALISIEDLAKRHDVPAWALAGLKARMSWAEGKQIEESKFLSALRKFTGGPMRGGDKK